MFCPNCGTRMQDSTCAVCRPPMSPVQYSPSFTQDKSRFRRDFALTYWFALGTAIFWVLQSYVPNSLVLSAFGPLSSLLSLVARGSVLVSFIARSSNWLAVSAISSTSSLVLGVVGASVYGGYTAESWAVMYTWLFSLATLVTYFLQARKVGIRPYVLERKNQ